MTASSGYSFSLRTKLVIAGVLGAAIPVIALGALVLDLDRRELERLAREYQIAVLDDVAGVLETEVSGTADALETVGRALVDRENTEEVRLATSMALLEGDSRIDVIAVYDESGALLDVMREDAAARTTPPETLPAALRQRAASADLAVDTSDAERVAVVVPLHGAEAITGYLLTTVPIAGLREEVRRVGASRFAGVDTPLALTDARGHVLTGSQRALPDLPWVALATGMLDASVRLVGGDGIERIVSTRALPTLGWTIVAQIPSSRVFASLDRARLFVLLAILGAVLIAASIAVAVAAHLTRPVRALVNLAGELAARRFDRRVEVTTHDELAVLGRAMNGAAADLAESEVRLAKEAEIRGALGRYMPASVVERVVSGEQDLALGGRRQTISVLFADVVAFTRLTERLAPEVTVALLNELFTILTEIVFRHGGTVDKFVGDSIMALFGAPDELPDHASRAIAAAEDMMRWLEAGNVAWRERYGATIELAIGIHSGECIVGNLGSSTRMEYTAIGDVVNVAARLETVAAPSQILITEATRLAAGDGPQLEDLGNRELAGRSAPVHIWEVRT